MKLRELIIPCNKRTSNESYIPYGVDINKTLIPSRANLIGVDLSKYKIVNIGDFACNLMHICRDMCLPIAHNFSFDNICISPAYYVFKIKDNKVSEVNKYFIFLYFQLKEQDRKCWFYCDGSVRGNLSEERFLDINIPIPPIKIQNQYANVYNTLRKLSEQNEAIVKPLMDFCTGFMAKLLTKYKRVEIGDILEECVELNGSKYNVDRVIGLSTSKSLIPTKAKMEGVALKGYKVFKNNTIAYVSDTSRRGEKVSMGYNNSEEDYLVSSITTIFKSKDESILNTNFLFLYLCRESFDRYARYNSWGSARETFDWSEMCRVKIPLPPIEVQESIVAIYKCAEKARSIAERAREEMKRICPAMIQRAAHQ